jgi:hypothetical protein
MSYIVMFKKTPMAARLVSKLKKIPRVVRFALVGCVLAAGGGFVYSHAATTWNPGDIFIGLDNQFAGGDLNPSHFQVMDSTGVVKDDVSQVALASFTAACAMDPTTPNVDLWTAGFWDNKIRQFSGVVPHSKIMEMDLSPLTGGAAAGAAVTSLVWASDGTFYASSTYGTPQIFHFAKAATVGGQPTLVEPPFTVDATGYRGVDWIDLAADQHTMYYTSIDDFGVTPPVIHRYNLTTRQQLSSIPVTTGTSGTPLSTHVYSFRILPPGDGSGGFLVATDLDIFQLNPQGQAIHGFTQNPDFVQQMTQRGLPSTYSTFIDVNVTNDGQYVWAVAYPQLEDNGVLGQYVDLATGLPAVDPLTGLPLLEDVVNVVVPGQLFMFHIPTGTVQAGPFALGKVGDVEFTDAICVKREYAPAAEQPLVPCPGDYRCSPPPTCPGPSPFCVVPGAPVITQLVDTQRGNATYPNPTSTTTVVNSEHDTVNLTAQATSGLANNPAVTYAITGLPKGLTYNTTTGVITGVIAYDAGGNCGGSCQVHVTVTNTSGRTVSTVFNWRVNELDAPPVIASIPNQTSQHGQAIAPIALSATDYDASDATIFSMLVPQPVIPGLTFSAATVGALTPVGTTRSATITGAPQLQPGVQCPNGTCPPIAVTILADDNAGHNPPNASQLASFTWTLLNLPPTMAKPADQSSKPNVAVSLQVTAVDPNGDPLAYSFIAPAGSGFVGSATGLITGTPAIGVYPITVTADDGHGGTVSQNFTWRVSANSAPVCTAATASPSSLWPPDHKFVTIGIKGITDPDGDATTIKINRILQDESTTPDGHFDGDGCSGHHHSDNDDWDRWDDWGSGNTSIDGIISATNMSVAQLRAERAGTSDGRVYEIRFTASDPSGNSCTGTVFVGVPHDQGSQPVAVDSLVRYDSTVAGGPPLQGPGFNIAPKYVSPGDQTTNIGKAVTLATTATDINLDTLTYAASGLPAGLTIKSTTGVIAGTPTAAGVFTVTLTVSDPYGGSSTATFKWTIVANRPPVAGANSVTISKGAVTTITVLSNDSDPDGDPLNVTSVQGMHGGTATVNSNGTITYKPSASFIGIDQFTYTISDGRGGTATGVITITVSSHKAGDKCDHDLHKKGHYDGDGCEHDRCVSSSHH